MEWQEEPQLDIVQLAALARAAMTASPDRPGAWLGLGRALQRLGHYREAIDLLEKAVARMPAAAPLRVSLARANLMGGEYKNALEQVDLALRLDPENRDARVIYFASLYKTARWDATDRLVDEIARISPLEPFLFEVWARQADESGDYGRLLAHCEAALDMGLVCTNAVYFKALALARLGRSGEARDTISTERFVEVRDLPIPSGFASHDSFRKALAKEILVNPTLVPDPRGKSTRGGRQTSRLSQPDAPAVGALISQIKTAIEVYEAHLSAQSGTFGAVRPARARLDAWAVVYGAEGQQEPHRHPSSWLSGVYYVSAPRAPGERTYRGSLQLGILAKRDRISPPWNTREIEPVPGRLVMFPSYVPHATTSTGIESARISVAFDVVPAD